MIKSRYVVRVVPFDLSNPTVLTTATTHRGSTASRAQAAAAAAAKEKEAAGQEEAKLTMTRKRRVREVANVSVCM